MTAVKTAVLLLTDLHQGTRLFGLGSVSKT